MVISITSTISRITGIDEKIIDNFISGLDVDDIMFLSDLVKSPDNKETLTRIFSNKTSIAKSVAESVKRNKDGQNVIANMSKGYWCNRIAPHIGGAQLAKMAADMNAPVDVISEHIDIIAEAVHAMAVLQSGKVNLTATSSNPPYTHSISMGTKFDSGITALDQRGVDYQIGYGNSVLFDGSNPTVVCEMVQYATTVDVPNKPKYIKKQDYQQHDTVHQIGDIIEMNNGKKARIAVANGPSNTVGVVTEGSHLAMIDASSMRKTTTNENEIDRIARLAGIPRKTTEEFDPLPDDMHGDITVPFSSQPPQDGMPVSTGYPMAGSNGESIALNDIRNNVRAIKTQMDAIKVSEYRELMVILDDLANSARVFGMDNLR